MADTNELLRRKFSELCAQRDAILAKSIPLREQRDGIVAKAAVAAAKADAVTGQIKEIEAPLFDLHNEIATISRALGGKTAV